MFGEASVEDGMPVGFRRAVFEGAGAGGVKEVGAVEEGFGALGEEGGGRGGVGEGGREGGGGRRVGVWCCYLHCCVWGTE